MRAELGFEPAYTTAEAFADFGGSLAPGLTSPGRLASPDRVLAGLAGSLPGGERHG
jgi:UDP-glucose 4-epimerase